MSKDLIEMQDQINMINAALNDTGRKAALAGDKKRLEQAYDAMQYIESVILSSIKNRLDALIQEAEDAAYDRELLASFPQQLRDELRYAAEDFPCDYEHEPTAEEYTEALFNHFYEDRFSSIAGLVDRWLYLLTGSSENEMPKSCEAVIQQVLHDSADDVFERRAEVDSDT